MIVSCGSAIMDMLPEPVPGGCNMNVAITAARLGAPTAFLGRVSTDHYGDLLVKHLADSGVDLSLVERGPERTARAIVSTQPSPTFEFDADGAADSALESNDLSPIGPGPHIVHGGTNVDYRGRTAHTIVSLIETSPGLVSCDPNIRPALIDDRSEWESWHDRWVAATSLYRCSDEDLGWIWPGRAPSSVAAELLDRGPDVVIVTAGSSGCQVFGDGWSVSAAARAVSVKDTVGAGDGFIGSLLTDLHAVDARDPAALARVSEDDWRRIAQRACEVAAVVCTRIGADPPWASELPEPTGR